MSAGGGLHENKNAQEASKALAPGYTANLFGCFTDMTGCILSCFLPVRSCSSS